MNAHDKLSAHQAERIVCDEQRLQHRQRALGQLTASGDLWTSNISIGCNKVSIDNPAFPKINPLSKDQYKIYAEVNQNLYDGGTIKTHIRHVWNKCFDKWSTTRSWALQIKDRINQIYFGILLLDQQLIQVDLLKKDILSSSAKVKASIENGTAFRMNADILEAESLKTDQRTIEIKASRRAYLAMLSLFIKQDLPEMTKLTEPQNLDIQLTDDITRPELSLSTTSANWCETSMNSPLPAICRAGSSCRVATVNPVKHVEKWVLYLLFGRPSAELEPRWFYNTKREKQLLDVNTRMIDAQQEVFQFNTKLSFETEFFRGIEASGPD